MPNLREQRAIVRSKSCFYVRNSGRKVPLFPFATEHLLLRSTSFQIGEQFLCVWVRCDTSTINALYVVYASLGRVHTVKNARVQQHKCAHSVDTRRPHMSPRHVVLQSVACTAARNSLTSNETSPAFRQLEKDASEYGGV